MLAGIKSTSIFASLIVPDQSAFASWAAAEFTFKSISFIFFFALAIKGILLEAANIVKCLGMVLSVLIFGLVFAEFSAIIRPIWKDESSFSMRFTLNEVSNVETFVFFVHFSEAVRFLLSLYKQILYVNTSYVNIVAIFSYLDIRILQLLFYEKFLIKSLVLF